MPSYGLLNGLLFRLDGEQRRGEGGQRDGRDGNGPFGMTLSTIIETMAVIIGAPALASGATTSARP